MARKLDPEAKARNKNLVQVFKYLIPIVKGKLLRNRRTEAAQDQHHMEEFEKVLHWLEFYSRDSAPPVSLKRAKEVLDFWELHQAPAFRHWCLKQNSVMGTQDKSMRIFMANTLNY